MGDILEEIPCEDLKDMKILTDEGTRLGKVENILITVEGKVKTLAVDPATEDVAHSLELDEDDNILVPFSSVIALKDYVVVKEENLGI